MTVKLEDFSQKYQGFLDYPIDKVNDKKMNIILLNSYFETKYRVRFTDNEQFETKVVDKELANFFETDGAKIEKFQIKRYCGRKRLFKLPVEITKDLNKDHNVKCIRIKIIGNNYNSMMKKINLLIKNLSEYGIKPFECIRDRKDLEEGIDKDIGEDENKIGKDEDALEVPCLE